MIKAVVKFYSQEIGGYGMPVTYYSYFLVSSPWETKDSAVASVIPISGDAARPNPPHTLVQKGGVDAAYKQMLNELRNLPQNKGLKERIDQDDS